MAPPPATPAPSPFLASKRPSTQNSHGQTPNQQHANVSHQFHATPRFSSTSTPRLSSTQAGAGFTNPALAIKPRVPRTRSTQDIIDDSSPVSDHEDPTSRSLTPYHTLPEPIEFDSPIAPPSSPPEEHRPFRSAKRRRVSIASSDPGTETNPEPDAVVNSQLLDTDLESLPDDGDTHIASRHSREVDEENDLEGHSNQLTTAYSSYSSSSPTLLLPSGSDSSSQRPALSSPEQVEPADVTKPYNNKPTFRPAPRFRLPDHTQPEPHHPHYPPPNHEDSAGYLPDIFSPQRRGAKYLPGGLAAELRDWLVEVKGGVSVREDEQAKPHDPCSTAGETKVLVEQVRRGGPGMTLVSGRRVNDVGDGDNNGKKGAKVKVILAGEGIVQGLGGGDGNWRRVVSGAVVTVSPPVWEVELDDGGWVVAYRWEVLLDHC